jgi:hypothetical protein
MDGKGKGERETLRGREIYKEKVRKKTPSVEERGAGIFQVSASLIPEANCNQCR